MNNRQSQRRERGPGTGKGIADRGFRIAEWQEERREQGPRTGTAPDDAEPHLAVQLAGRVLLGQAKGNNGGNRQPGTGNRKRRTGSEVATMARHGQVLPPVPAPGRNTLCKVVLLTTACPELPRIAPGIP